MYLYVIYIIIAHLVFTRIHTAAVHCLTFLIIINVRCFFHYAGRLQKQQEMNKNKEIIVLDHKRSNAINIGMTKLPPPRSIKTAILKMDATIMNREGIEVISFFFVFFFIHKIIIISYTRWTHNYHCFSNYPTEIVDNVTNRGGKIQDTRGAGRQSRSSFGISRAVSPNFGIDFRASSQIETLGFQA